MAPKIETLKRLAEKAASFLALDSHGRDSRAVANYLLRKAAAGGRQLTVMHLLKLVYIAHGIHLGMTGRPLIRDRVEAWMLGPVIPRVYEEFPPGTRGVFLTIRKLSGEPYDAEFSDDERWILDLVYDKYSPLSAYRLSEITHEPDAPWNRVKDRGEFAVIPDDIIRDYYHGLIEDAKKSPA